MKEIPYSLSLKAQETEEVDSDFSMPGSSSIPPFDEEIDPGFSVTPEEPSAPSTPIVPSTPTIPSAPVYPSAPSIPSIPVFPSAPSVPSIPPAGQIPVYPCLFCESDPWIAGAIRLLNTAVGYNSLRIYIDGMLAATALDFAQLTGYRRISQGYHTFLAVDEAQNINTSKSIYVDSGMATIAFTNGPSGLNILSIPDPSCPASFPGGCLRVCNLAWYSGNLNVSVGNLTFQSVSFGQPTSFSSLNSGSYPLRIARSERPGNTLISSTLRITSGRIHTLYVFNWNPSPDTIQTLLSSDWRG